MNATETGHYGTAAEAAVPHDDEANKVGLWLITMSSDEPPGPQYLMTTVGLDANVPGAFRHERQFPHATHQIMIAGLNPARGAMTVDSLQSELIYRWEPFNVVEQFTATDDQMRTLMRLAAKAVVEGVLDPDTSTDPDRARRDWKLALTRTLADLRGEHS